MLVALTRPVSAGIEQCELTYLPRVPIDLVRAREQHARYCDALRALGARVLTLPAAPELPDAVFVEDMAVVVNEVAILTRPGAPSRRPELAAVAAALAAYRPLAPLQEPAELDGGDVLQVGRTLYVGTGGRSNTAGVDQLRAILTPHGYAVQAVTAGGCLHLKSAATALDARTVLVNDAWIDAAVFAPHTIIRVAAGEPWAANALSVGDRVLLPAGNPGTQARLEAAGFRVLALDISELQKAEGALTCQSLLLEVPAPAPAP